MLHFNPHKNEERFRTAPLFSLFARGTIAPSSGQHVIQQKLQSTEKNHNNKNFGKLTKFKCNEMTYSFFKIY